MAIIDDDFSEEIHPDFDYKKHIVNNKVINDEMLLYVQGKMPRGYKTGIQIIDDVIVMKPKEMFACTGKKGRGKTTIQQILFLMWAMANDLHCVLSLQENKFSLSKKDLLGYCLGENPRDVYNRDVNLYNNVLYWLDNHFTFIEVSQLSQAYKVVESMINDNIKVDLLFCDPVNSFEDVGINPASDKNKAIESKNFAHKICSLFISQHPTISGQRSDEDVNSYSAEGGAFLNKADFTWAINRNNNENINRIGVDNIRNKYTGGNTTHKEAPLLIEWGKYNINAMHMGATELDIIQQVRRMYNPFKEVFSEQNNWIEEKKELPTITPSDAFGEPEDNNDDLPF